MSSQRLPRIDKDKYELFKDRSFIKLKTFLRNIFELTTSWPSHLIQTMSLIFRDFDKFKLLFNIFVFRSMNFIYSIIKNL